MSPILEVRNLSIGFPTASGEAFAVADVSFSIGAGEVLGFVGESGAGKSLTGAAVIQLVAQPGYVAGGEVLLEGRRIDNLPDHELRRIRGRKIGMVFQDPMTSLDPLFTIGMQLSETLRAHQDLTRAQAREQAIEWLHRVGIPSPGERVDQYPHQLSGGMRQRVVLALALCTEPEMLIADEPTTALDVSVQAQMLDLLKDLCRERNIAIMLITHDMGVVAEMADRVAVMYSGQIVEIGPVAEVLNNARHPYTRGLISAIPELGKRTARLLQIPGNVPKLGEAVRGCAFHPRCSRAQEICSKRKAPVIPTESGRVSCWHPHEQMA